MATATKPRLLKAYGVVWQCRSPEFWGTGMTAQAAYADWHNYMQRFHP